MKTVDDFNIGVAEIFCIAVDEKVVPAGGAIVFNSETGKTYPFGKFLFRGRST